MSHNINERRMCYYGEVPWHGIGTKLDNPATAVEAIAAAGLDYEVAPQRLYTSEGIEAEDRRAIVRLDTKRVLGVVSDRYQPVQNKQAFGFFDVVVGEGQAIYHTAGALGAGERIWMLAKLPNDIVVAAGDRVEKYLALVNSHDGTSSLMMYFTPVRIVCQNTLNASMRHAASGISIRHVGEIMHKVDDVRKTLGLVIDVYAQFEKLAKQFVGVKLDVAKADAYFERVVFGEKEKEAEAAVVVAEASSILKNRKLRMLELFESGRGNDIPEVKHTLWAAYNAVTEYSDHCRVIRGEDSDKSRRLTDAWFGAGAYMKTVAYDTALEFAGIKK